MAPKYAPSLRARLPPAALLLQIGFILVFAFFVEIEDRRTAKETSFVTSYARFQDVHVMVFMGFGFMATFLFRYAFSASAFVLLVGAMAVQWAAILNGFLNGYLAWKIRLRMESLVEAELCAASALVAMGAVHGKTSPVQLLVFSLVEVTGFELNRWLINMMFKYWNRTFQMLWIEELLGLTLLHVFGALFGIMASWVLYRRKMETRHEKEKFSRKNCLFAMLGTLFLWMFWPSFNWALVQNKRAVFGTYLSLAVSAVTAAAVSVLSSPRGKFNLVNIQRSMLAGGVAVSAVVPTPHGPWVAMTIGLCATLLSGLGVRYMKGHVLSAFECHDTCGVLSVHAVPALFGWLVQLCLRLASISDVTIAVRFTVHHICVLLITLAVSLVTGFVTGLVLKWRVWNPQQDRKCYDDQAFWEFSHLAVQK